jgi:hypothetical protein
VRPNVSWPADLGPGAIVKPGWAEDLDETRIAVAEYLDPEVRSTHDGSG